MKVEWVDSLPMWTCVDEELEKCIYFYTFVFDVFLNAFCAKIVF